MLHDTPRGRRRRWTWTFVGLLQIGNAAAFGAVATSIDFSAADGADTIADVEEAASEGVDQGLEAAVASAVQAETAATSEITPTFVGDGPSAPSTSVPPSVPGSPDVPGSPIMNDTAGIDPMPTFALGPRSPLTEDVPWTTSRTPSAGEVAASTSDEPATPPEPPPVVEPLPPAAPAIVNSSDASLTVRFLVNGELVALLPGERRELSGGDAWVVRFHRGGEYGAATEILYGGEHRFVVGSQGWQLEPVEDESAVRPTRGD